MLLTQAQASLLTDEPSMTSMEKWRLLADWDTFVSSGFEYKQFTSILYQFLVRHCGFIKLHQNQAAFWEYYFQGDVDCLRLFLQQFGAGVGAETGSPVWLTTAPAQDLKEMFRQRLGLVYEAMLQGLADLEHRHGEVIQAWGGFALQNSLLVNVAPPRYRVSANTRQLLAYIGQIALQYQQRIGQEAQQLASTAAGSMGGQHLVSPVIQQPASWGAGW